MYFFFETIAIPFWFIAVILASATPLWLKWYKKFHIKFIASGILKKKFQRKKSTADMKMDVLQKATEHMNAQDDMTGFSESTTKKRKAPRKEIDQVKKQNIQKVLKVLAEGGETGVLPKSISDNVEINTVETTSALTYLTGKNYAEVINSTSGTKYYLTDLGRRYCLNKKYISK